VFDAGTGDLKIQSGGNTKLEVTGSGAAVTGNITVSGTVDGRDVAADGTKLDGIESSATADHTAAEIRTLVESASDSNVFTDADHTKLNGITASANNYVHPNHSGEVTSTADGATVIADNIVDEANLKVSNSPTNGYFLSAQSGNTGGLTWAEATNFTTLTEHTGADANNNSAGDLIFEGTDTDSSGSVTDDDRTKYDKSLNTFNIGKNVNINIGHLNISTKTAATTAVNSGLTGYVTQYSAQIGNSTGADIWLSSQGKKITIGTSDSLTHEVARFQCASVGSSQHGYVDLNYVIANAGSSASSANRLKTTETGMTLTGVVVPAADSTHDFGTTSVRWRNIYADTLYGDGSNLTGISAGATGGNSGANGVFWENDATVTHDYTITNNKNAGSFGPITINNGVTVTVGSGEIWTIV
jgi:hypothetical protein